MLQLSTRLLPCLLLVASHASLAQSDRALELQSGVLVDADRDRVFIMDPDGAVEAVSLGNGQRLWRSEAGARPLTLDQNRLLVQSDSREPGRLDLVILDTEDGSVLQRRELPLPDDVLARIDHGLSSRFELERGPGQGRMSWRFIHRTARGIPGQAPEGENRMSGQFSVDLAAARITDLGVPAPGPITASVELAAPRGPARRFQSRDGNSVLSSEPLPAAGILPRHRWTLEDAAGNALGETVTMVAYSPFAVVDRILLFITPPNNRFENGQELQFGLTLHAVDLRSGETLWSRELRDVRYVGPFPV